MIDKVVSFDLYWITQDQHRRTNLRNSDARTNKRSYIDFPLPKALELLEKSDLPKSIDDNIKGGLRFRNINFRVLALPETRIENNFIFSSNEIDSKIGQKFEQNEVLNQIRDFILKNCIYFKSHSNHSKFAFDCVFYFLDENKI